MTTIITFQESNYTDSGYFYRCPGHHFDDLSNEYVPLAEYEALTAERTQLRAECKAHAEAPDALARRLKDLEELRDHLSDKLQEARQLQANQREANALLARERKKAEAERDALRDEVARRGQALKPFAKLWREAMADKSDDTPVYGINDVIVTVGQIKAARYILSKVEGQGPGKEWRHDNDNHP